VSPATATSFDVHHIVLYREGPAFGQYLEAGLTTWGQWWGAYRQPAAYFDLDWRDWRVTARTLYEASRALAGGILRHWKLRA